MSKKNRHRHSLAVAPNAVDTAQPVDQPTTEPSTEKTMEASTEQTVELEPTQAPEPEALEPTAKEMAAAEELNALRAKQIAAYHLEQAKPKEPEPTILELAAQGYDALHEQMRRANAEKPPVYTPPPRTERQMSALQEELEAGRRAQLRHEEQAKANAEARAAALAAERLKEGFNTPVYRPGEAVPNPVTGKLGGFSPDA